MHLLPTYDDVVAAAQRLQGQAHRTPVLSSSTADAQLGAQLFFKCENFQRMGAFKFRGGFNALAQFTPEQKKHGALAFSSGNHAQAIALAARILGMPATILMPQDAPAAKLAATRGYGAEVITFDRFRDDREALARRLSQERGMTLIPPFDHAHVIAGQGTAAKELFEEVPDLTHLFVCVGGGGLISGCALAAKALAPDCKVYGVEPLAGNDGQQSLQRGERVRIEMPETIADGAQTQQLGVITFEVIRRDVEAIFTVPDSQLASEMRFYAERMKMVVEPTGCLSLAGARHSGLDLKGARIGILVSGGNVDMSRFSDLIAG
ncbi:threo-3-hydroxy-L-aspartate ammonia-lyase [uncultured Ramlibacter sp.]|uniref:threo-3-hydroxy-L-aspartate ammonia-lyase n=1 Tax=uncultured Ramlibacter sp. TaxID=260755 RepID=UPI00261D0FF8|nr:threo-3-hydroxy-L-aspartate ammonia-lyase [uncultured Ramlibacter sp.]